MYLPLYFQVKPTDLTFIYKYKEVRMIRWLKSNWAWMIFLPNFFNNLELMNLIEFSICASNFLNLDL